MHHNWAMSSNVLSENIFQDEDIHNISAKINWIDYLAIAIYFVAIIIVAIWVSSACLYSIVDFNEL